MDDAKYMSEKIKPALDLVAIEEVAKLVLKDRLKKSSEYGEPLPSYIITEAEELVDKWFDQCEDDTN